MLTKITVGLSTHSGHESHLGVFLGILTSAQNSAKNWPMCAQLIKRHKNRKILKILFSSIALSSALTAATASTKHFGAKVVRYFTVLCINAAVTGSKFHTVTDLKVICVR